VHLTPWLRREVLAARHLKSNACTYRTASVLCCSLRLEPPLVNNHARMGVVGHSARRCFLSVGVRDECAVAASSWSLLSRGDAIGAETPKLREHDRRDYRASRGCASAQFLNAWADQKGAGPLEEVYSFAARVAE
jgi:hypothetical protein